jgi:hypothetical protein
MAQRSIRQLDIDIVIPVDPPPVTTIEGYILDTLTDIYLARVDYFPSLVRSKILYHEWFPLHYSISNDCASG